MYCNFGKSNTISFTWLLFTLSTGCSLAIHVVPPSLRNQGTALAALLMIGDYGQGERGVGNMSAFWDGGDGLNIPYYGSQTLSKFYLEVFYLQRSRYSIVRFNSVIPFLL